MRTQISQQQIESYRKNGFLVIEGFLNDEELQEFRKTTDDAVAQRLDAVARGSGDRTNQHDPESYYSQVFTQCVKLADTHDGMRRLMYDERLGNIAGTLAGVDGVRIWHDQALIKPPFGNPTGWHVDNPFWSFSSRDAISIWLALDDATLSNGCLYYIPGSHKEATFDNYGGIGQNIGSLFSRYPQWAEREPVAGPCPAGSAVFHNGLTAHGAGANMTNKSRRAMTCAYMPDGSTFNGVRNVLPEDYFNSLKIGDVLDKQEVVPLIWKR